MSCCLRILIGHRVPISNVVERHRSCWTDTRKLPQAQKIIRGMLLVKRTVMLIIARNALWFFTISWKVFPFAVDLSIFCRRVRVGRKTTAKIYVILDDLLVNELHHVIRRNCLLKLVTTCWYNINFWANNIKNWMVCRVLRRVFGFKIVVHHFKQKWKIFSFDRLWALNSDRIQVLVRLFTSGCVCWLLGEASCCSWEWFLKSVYS